MQNLQDFASVKKATMIDNLNRMPESVQKEISEFLKNKNSE